MTDRYCPLRLIAGTTHGCLSQCAFYDKRQGECRLVMFLDAGIEESRKEGEERCRVLNSSILSLRADIEHSISFLRMTIGSRPWLDFLTSDQINVIREEILPHFLAEVKFRGLDGVEETNP